MSSTHAKSTIVRSAVGRSQRRAGLLGLGAVLAGVTAVGAAVAVFLIPAAAPTTAPAIPLPAMDAGLGYGDHVDARPAGSAYEESQSYRTRAEARPAVPVAVGSSVDYTQGYFDAAAGRTSVRDRIDTRMDAYMGVADRIDTRPASSFAPPPARWVVVETAQGYQETLTTGSMPAMPNSMGVWDVIDARPVVPVAPAAPRLSDPEMSHDAIRGAAWIDGPRTDQPVPSSAEDGYFDEGPQGYEWRPRPGR